MMVRCILAETTMPERIRPRIEIWPVKGHFLSTLLDGEARDNATNISSLDGLLGGLEAQTDVLVPSLLLCLSRCFGVLEDVGLLEEGSLRLHCQFGHGDCRCCCRCVWLDDMAMCPISKPVTVAHPVSKLLGLLNHVSSRYGLAAQFRGQSLVCEPSGSRTSNLFPVVADGSASARYKSEIELNFRLAYWLLLVQRNLNLSVSVQPP